MLMCCKGIAIKFPARLDIACVSKEKVKDDSKDIWPEQLEG